MSLRFTPLNIRNQEFSKKLQGYKPDEVRIFLSQVAEFADNLLQENRSLRNEIDALHKRISTLERQATTIKEAMEEQAERAIADAREEADRVLSEAEQEAQQVLRNMQLEVDKRREELYELSGIYGSYKSQLLRVLEGLLNSINEFENTRETRNADKAVNKLGVRLRPLEPTDAVFVLKHTVHRRRRNFFMRSQEQDEE